jgi:hypothetical protein
VGAVEDPDPAGDGHLAAHPPQEVVGQLLLGGLLERGDLQALRVDEPADVPDHPALAGGVHPLQHQQRGAGAPAGGLGVEGLLQVVEAVGEVHDVLGRRGLVPGPDRARPRVE